MASWAQLADLRRGLSAELLYAMQGRAACKSMPEWVIWERQHQQAESAEAAQAASAPALEVCAGCPVQLLCEVWAVVERYDGLAAGHAWVAGRRRDPAVTQDADGGWLPSYAAGLGWVDLSALVQRLAMREGSK